MEPVSVQLYRSFILLILMATLVLSLLIDMPSTFGLYAGSVYWARLSYHFFHGGIIHWTVNAFAFLTIAFRWQLPWWHYAVSFIVACLIPAGSLWSQPMPIVGLSVWIYALIGMITPSTAHPYRVVIINILCIMSGLLAISASQLIASIIDINRAIPVIAWQAHLYAYIVGILIGLCIHPVWHHK